MNKPRVCHVSTVHKGVEIRIVRKELASLASAGYDAHAVIEATPEEVKAAADLGVTIHPLSRKSGSSRLTRMTSKMYQAWRLCRQVNARLYHFHDPELIPLGLLLKAFGYHVVMDVHEDLANQILNKHWIPSIIRPTLSRLARLAERIGARFYDGVVTASPMQAEFFPDVARRLTVLHNFPLLSELAVQVSPQSEAEATSTQANPRPLTHVVYVGGISRIRGVNEAIQAAERAGVKLILAGTFRTEAERQYATSLPGWKQVEELGWVERDGIAAAMNHSFAGLCALHPTANHINAEPIKLFEYMAAGIPSIVSTIPTWTPYVEKHDAGICVDPMDIDAIVEAIITLKDNPERAAEMGRNGQRAVLEHYNWSTQAKKLEALYQDILKA